MPRLRQFRFRGGRAHRQFGAALFVGAAARLRAVASIAIWFSRSRFCRISVSIAYPRCVRSECSASDCCTPSVCCRISSPSWLICGIESHAFLIHLRELAGQHDAQFGAHLVAQSGIALRLAGLALQRIHLPRDFFENVVDAVQVLLGIFQARFGQALLGLEFRDPGGFFNDGAAVGGTAAQNLPDASLLDQRVGLGAEARAHEQFLDVAQAAQFSIQQVFAVAATGTDGA